MRVDGNRMKVYASTKGLNFSLEVLGIMAGYPVCANCDRKVTIPATQGKKKTTSCPYCGHPHMAIRIGKHPRIYGYPEPYTFERAIKDLQKINVERSEGRFDIKKWARKAIEERLFENVSLRWLAERQKQQEQGAISPGYFLNIKSYIKNHFPGLNGKEAPGIKVGDLQDWYDGLQGSAKLRQNVLNELQMMFNWLLSREEITHDQSLKVGQVKAIPIVTDRQQSSDFDTQISDLSNVPEEDRDIIEFLMDTGLRISEACALMKIDLIPKNRSIVIRHNYSGCKLTSRPKQRRITTRILSDRAWELILRNIDNPTPFIFWNKRTGKGYRYKVLWSTWKRCAESGIGLKASTRHTLPELMFAEGAYPKVVMEQLGHADLKTTMGYSHPDEGRVRDLMNKQSRKVVDIKSRVSSGLLDSVKKYGKVEVATRKTLLEVKVLPLKKEKEDADGYLS